MPKWSFKTFEAVISGAAAALVGWVAAEGPRHVAPPQLFYDEIWRINHSQPGAKSAIINLTNPTSKDFENVTVKITPKERSKILSMEYTHDGDFMMRSTSIPPPREEQGAIVIPFSRFPAEARYVVLVTSQETFDVSGDENGIVAISKGQVTPIFKAKREWYKRHPQEHWLYVAGGAAAGVIGVGSFFWFRSRRPAPEPAKRARSPARPRRTRTARTANAD
jgi:hypothetical protein